MANEALERGIVRRTKKKNAAKKRLQYLKNAQERAERNRKARR